MKKNANGLSLLLHILIGMGVSIGVLLIMLLITAFVASRNGVSDTVCLVLVVISAIMAWGAGGFTVGLRNRRSGLLVGAMHSWVMLLLVILVSLIVRGSEITLFGVKFLLYLFGGTAVGGIGGIFGVHFALKNR